VTLLAFTIAYLTVHFALYVVVLRHIPAFGSERMIFLYHAVPAGILALVTAAVVSVAQDPAAVAVGILAISLQGLYSLSFLELWALSDGGYSLQILEHIARSSAFDAGDMKEIGASKRTDRLESAIHLRLVQTDGSVFSLTGIGHSIAGAFAAIVWVVNAKQE
jgi:hypothetical protein